MDRTKEENSWIWRERREWEVKSKEVHITSLHTRKSIPVSCLVKSFCISRDKILLPIFTHTRPYTCTYVLLSMLSYNMQHQHDRDILKIFGPIAMVIMQILIDIYNDLDFKHVICQYTTTDVTLCCFCKMHVVYLKKWDLPLLEVKRKIVIDIRREGRSKTTTYCTATIIY